MPDPIGFEFYPMGFGFNPIGFRFYPMGFEFYSMEFGSYSMEFGSYFMGFGSYFMEFGFNSMDLGLIPWDLKKLIFPAIHWVSMVALLFTSFPTARQWNLDLKTVIKYYVLNLPNLILAGWSRCCLWRVLSARS